MEKRGKKYKKHHIVIGIWIIVFKVLVISSLIYIAYILVEIRADLELTRENQLQIEEQINLNQQSIQSQINEISNSLLRVKEDFLNVKEDFDDEIAKLKATSSADFSGVIEQVIPGVVSIGTDISQGSGFIISDDGYIITNFHVLSGATFARALLYESSNWIPAQLVGYDKTLDIAIIKIPITNLNYLEFGDSEDIKVGEKAIALGNPLGLSFSVTEGIVSGLKREGPNGIPAYIQIDTPLNPGNSGGPLVNKEGKVIGINNFKIQGSENLGFALESNYAVETINTIFEANNQTIRT